MIVDCHTSIMQHETLWLFYNLKLNQMNKLTVQQIVSLWEIAQRQLLVNDKLSKALWGILKQVDAPIIDYVDVCKILQITNPAVAEEFIYAMYECPAD
jgi:hypothetical protein